MIRRSLALLLVTGCAHYTPVPLDLAAAPADYAARRLDDSATTAALTALGAPAGWNVERLAAAAWWLRPERKRSEAEIAAAEAGLRRAGARPDPGASLGLEQSFSGTDGTSPWAVGGGPSVTFELGGKRAARQVRVQAEVVAARAAGVARARGVKERVRVAALALFLARRALGQSEIRAGLTDSLLAGLQQRFADGAISRLELARAAGERQAADVEIATLRREVEAADAALASAVGVPPGRLDGLPIVLEGFPRCDVLLRSGHDSLRSAALAHRPEVGEAIAAYLTAEADVRLEVAQSWPDLVIGPGLLFDHGVGKWTIGFGVPALALNRHRGPIMEAEARRTVAAVRVSEVQESLLGEVDTAIAACQATGRELGTLVALGERFAAREAVSRGAFDRGEIGAVELLQDRRLALSARQEQESAAARALQAALQLDAATRP